MEINKLKQKEYNLKPYDFFVALFDIADGDDTIPIFNKFLFNSFNTTPEFTNTRESEGLYSIIISNYTDFKIVNTDDVSVLINPVISKSSTDKVEGFFIKKFDEIQLQSIDLDTSLLSNFTGQFVMYYYKYY